MTAKKRTITKTGLGSGTMRRVTTAPPPSQPRPHVRSDRPAIRVDEVGDAAAGLSARVSLGARPRALKTRLQLAEAPLDPRAAFVLSLVDGRMTVQQIVDVAGMAEDEVFAILVRLRRLGIVALA